MTRRLLLATGFLLAATAAGGGQTPVVEPARGLAPDDREPATATARITAQPPIPAHFPLTSTPGFGATGGQAGVGGDEVEVGDPRLIFAGAVAGGAVGYLVGFGAALGIASVLGSEPEWETATPYLIALPPLFSAAGSAAGGSRTSCLRLYFGAVYPLNSCADARLIALGAVPGAVAGYFLPKTDPRAIAATVFLEAAGVALVGRFARQPR